MLNICSLFQKFFGFIKNVQKKTYRTCMVIVSGVMLVSIICLTAKDFGGSGKNKALAVVDKASTDIEAETEDDETDANALVQNMLFSYGNTNEDENSSNALNVYKRISEILNNNGNIYLEEMPTASIMPISTELLEAPKKGKLVEKTKETEEETETTEAPPVTEAETETATETTVTEEQTTEEVIYTPVNVEVTETDYYWLTRIVEAEAGNQDENGRIMVANVIINRVKSGKFPSSVKEVIFQNDGRTYQFEPVKNERIYDAVPSDTTINCVDRALNGEDYSEGALFFTMKTSSHSWFNTSLTLLFVHGDHYFYTY